MRIWKKLLTGLLAATMVLTVTACGSDNSSASTAQQTTTAETQTEEPAEEETAEEEPAAEAETETTGEEADANSAGEETAAETETAEAETETTETETEPAAETETTETEPAAETETTETEPAAETETTETEPAADTETAETTEPESEQTGGTLVVYFSATGNTQAVAQTIADTLGAEIYQIVPEQPYTDEDLNWNVADSRVNVEHEDPSFRPAIAGGVPDLSGYDTIFIGSPLWWREAPNIVWNFVESADLSGKTVIPFCTSMSDDIGSSGDTLAAMAPEATWLAGARFGESLDEASVVAWVEGLGV